MKVAKILLALMLLLHNVSFAQGTFQSKNNGNWNSPSSWMLVSGTSSTNYPGAGDTVNITNKNVIAVNANSSCNEINVNDTASLVFNTAAVTLSVSNSLSMAGGSTLTMNQGILIVTGSMTQNSSSVVTVNQGALTVIGLMFLNPPSSAGTTLLDVEGGAFSCAGGMSITGLTSTRLAELRIGNSAVNIAGGLATFTSNAKINFTGTGSLTLAGVISIANASSFIPGNGRVIYFGIPGSNQVIAPLTYNRLVVTGVGSGLKKIDGTVTVTDTLTLLTDTLQVDAGGILNMNNNTVLVKTAGKIITPPTFLGTIDVIYNNIVKDTTGMEMPSSTSALRNLIINDVSGIKLSSDVTVNNNLNLQQGALLTDIYTLNITNSSGGVTMDPAVQRTNGYITGTVKRSIGTSTGIRNFPFGVGTLNGYREFQLNYTIAPTVAGTLTVQHFDTSASNQSGLPLIDGIVVISKTAPVYWQADATNLSGGTYNLSLTDDGADGVSNINALRIVKRPSTGGAWTLNGTAGTNTGTTTAPVIIRNGMSGFSQFTFGSDNTNTLPIKLLSFSGKLSGKNIVLSWATANENNSNYFEIESSKSGNDFAAIGKLPGTGNTAQQANYSFTDYNVSNGTNYYKLKQFDADGSFTYSNIIYIKISKSNTLRIYPTLASQQITVEATSDENIKVYDINGRFMQKLIPGSNDINKLAKGIYFATDEAKNVVQFIKQ